MQGQGRDFSIFIIQQSNRFRFNKGMLLNVGVSLLRRSDYDYFVFHDVDLTPSEIGQVPYDYPFGTSLSSFHDPKPLDKIHRTVVLTTTIGSPEVLPLQVLYI